MEYLRGRKRLQMFLCVTNGNADIGPLSVTQRMTQMEQGIIAMKMLFPLQTNESDNFRPARHPRER